MPGLNALIGLGVAFGIISDSLDIFDYFSTFAGDAHQYIADEVATNHIELETLATNPFNLELHEVGPGDMDEMREFFKPLPVNLTEPLWIRNKPWQVTGGRVCKIQGKAAAQLRMHDNHGGMHTVYQIPYNPSVHRGVPDVLRGAVPLTLHSQWLKVRLWQERGLLFAMVSR